MTPDFKSYTVIDGSKLRPSNPNIPTAAPWEKEWDDFESFASQQEFPLANPEALKGRTEIPREEVEVVNQVNHEVHGWVVASPEYGRYMEYISRQAYIIKEGKEEKRTCDCPAFTELQRDHEALKERYGQLEKVFEDAIQSMADVRYNGGLGFAMDIKKMRDNFKYHWRTRAGLSKEGK